MASAWPGEGHRIVNTRQKTALKQHCRLPEETVNPALRYQRGLHSIVLTVNSGFE